MPWIQPGYNPYTPYLPGAMIGLDGQPYFPDQMIPQLIALPGVFPFPIPFGSEVMPVFPWYSSPVYEEGVHGNGFSGSSSPTFPGSKPNFFPPNHALAPSKPSKSSMPGETKGNSPASVVVPNAGVQNLSLKPMTKVTQLFTLDK